MTMQPSENDVLYEDNHLLAINKPAGLLTQHAGVEADNLEDMARSWVKITRNKPGNVYLHAVHRLDRVTSGVALFALREKALQRMNAAMRARSVTKIYHALITREPPGENGTLVHYMRHSRMRSRIVGREEKDARRAELDYQVLKRSGRLILLEIRLVTGRYHQIRAQLGACGCPVVGDQLYGSHDGYAHEAIALHHRRMEFAHPTTKAGVIIEAGYPDAWPLQRS